MYNVRAWQGSHLCNVRFGSVHAQCLRSANLVPLIFSVSVIASQLRDSAPPEPSVSAIAELILLELASSSLQTERSALLYILVSDEREWVGHVNMTAELTVLLPASS